MRAAIAALAECGQQLAQLEAQQAQHAEQEEFELAAAVDSQIKEVTLRQDALQVRLRYELCNVASSTMGSSGVHHACVSPSPLDRAN